MTCRAGRALTLGVRSRGYGGRELWRALRLKDADAQRGVLAHLDINDSLIAPLMYAVLVNRYGKGECKYPTPTLRHKWRGPSQSHRSVRT